MPDITIKNLTFCYDGSYDNIFEDVSFQIHTDWKLGFTGRNGRGKTTFLKLLMGKYEYRGSIQADMEFEYFPYEIRDKERDTLEVLNEINGDYELWQLERELSKLSVSTDVLYRPFSTLSNGEQTKVLLAVMFIKENHFLLIDEPTNHLDIEGRQTVADYLNSKKGFILVSHDRAFLDACVDHILSINKADIEIQSGNFSSWYQNKKLKDEFELEQNSKLKKEIRRLETTAREKAAWSDKVEASKIGSHSADRGRIGHLAAKMMKRSKAIEKRVERSIEEKSGLLKNLEEKDSLKMFPLIFHGNRLLELSDLSIYYGSKAAVKGISFTLNQGDRLLLSGKNGSGKSSILKLVCGEELEFTGSFYRAAGLKISYVNQDTSGLFGSLTDYEIKYGIDGTLFRAMLRKLGFTRTQFDKRLEQLSGGQKKKVLIARSLCERAHLYVWDEPLNFVDVLSRIQIEELLQSCCPAMLFVEHDSMFGNQVKTKEVHL